MLREPVKDEIEDLLKQVPGMAIKDFQVINEHELSSFATSKGARPILKLGAADFSWLDKRVREAAGPCVTMLRKASNIPLAAGAVFMVLDAAQAIVRRDRLSEEQYEAFVGGFRQVGIDVPGWRDGWAVSSSG